MQLNGKVSLITGGSGGIGSATAMELARRGSDIMIVGRHIGSRAESIREEIGSLGRRCTLLEADLSRPEEATRSVRETVALMGGLDVLVHAAGGPAMGNLLSVASEAWYGTFDTHLHAVFHLCRAAVPYMREKREGAIVLIASAAGLRGCVGAIAYGVAKGALPQLARSMARELADDNIRVNAVSPGVIRTHFQDHLTPEQVKNNIANRIPLHREGTPQQVAQVIVELATNDYITGETLVIDGGLTMRIA